MNNLKIGKYVISFVNSQRIRLFYERNRQLTGFVQVEAINGKALPFSLVECLFEKKFINHQLKNKNDLWLKGTAGCLLSHIKAIEQAQKDDTDYAIIVEDDAVFRVSPDDILVLMHQHDYDVIYIYDGIDPGGQRQITGKFTISNLTISNLKGTGAVAYILSRNAQSVIINLLISVLSKGLLPCGYDGLLQSTVLKQHDRIKNPKGKTLSCCLYRLKQMLKKSTLEILPGKKGLWQWLRFRKTDLKVGVSSPTIVAHVDDGVSLIRH